MYTLIVSMLGDRVTGDLFVSSIPRDRPERRGAGYRSIQEVLRYQLQVDPSEVFLKIILIYRETDHHGYSNMGSFPLVLVSPEHQ